MDIKNKSIKATITSKNQITIPKEIRTLLNVKKNDVIEFSTNNNGEIVVASDNSLWSIVKDQEKKYGNVSTPEMDWGTDIGNEKIDW
ncbi:AbrB/MazE/SpoVT family DNA-binding domain-containing protein [Companilactobacillus kedongensis]|uniref:AbrB/MazE/SpoVT family DNA-binding domain-containing protein n=1 Tax=Companilactobacillus kedongensis TaxID=2486004 RepID=UPI000F7B790A|nr:AbrB/MazE/SpoVT family DNA-binding domain-containing protein [Companilactobacillus kedongensis]